MLIIISVMLIFALLEALYVYKLLKRGLNGLGVDTTGKKAGRALKLCAALIGVAGANIFSFSAVIILHVLAVAGVVQFLNFILKKCAKNKYAYGFKKWKKIYASCVIPAIITAIIMVCGYVNMHNIRETYYTVYTEKNIRDEGYRIALIADVHYGVSVNLAELEKKCNEISKKDVDAVILCGDIVDDSTSEKGMQEVFKALSAIKNKYGIFYVYGNHDRQLYSNDRKYSDVKLRKVIESNGIKILQDKVLEIQEDFVIVGREDASLERFSEKQNYKRASMDELLSDVNHNAFILTLDHQPREYRENGDAGTDLLLSGHTHGGQLWPVNILDNIFKFNEANYGLVQIDKDTQAIVTSGFAGWNYPVKTSAPAEYVIIDVKKK